MRGGPFKSTKPWVNAAWSLVYPDVCQLCHNQRATKAQGYVCDFCRSDVRWIEAPFCDRCGLPFEGDITTRFECTNCREMELHFTSARSAVAARGSVLEAIHHYKYDGHLWLEEFLNELFVRGAMRWYQEQPCDALIPVPLFATKRRERGFNQAERLAAELGKSLNVPVHPRALKRSVPTPTQTRLSRKQRAENMRSAFTLQRDNGIKGARLVLVDDVFTTGATTSACAKVLLRAGAERIAVWTVARAEFHG